MTEERQPYDVPPSEPAVPSGPVPERPASAPPEPPPVYQEMVPPPAPPAPPPPDARSLPPRPTGPTLSTGDFWRQRSDNLLIQLGIDARLAGRVTIIALAAGVIGALLDEILGLPGVTLRVSFGGTLVAGLAGLSYAYFKGREDAPSLIMAAFAGLVTYLAWYIVAEILGDAFMNVPKAMVSGVFAGIIGFGWLALLHAVPQRIGWLR